jgi:hypothetical protein
MIPSSVRNRLLSLSGSKPPARLIGRQKLLKPVQPAVQPVVKRTLAVATPDDRMVRKVAEAAAQIRRSSGRIRKFNRAIRTYCALALRYSDKTVVQEYVYLGLKRHISTERNHGRSLHRKDLEMVAEALILRIEDTILKMVKRGRILKVELPKDRYAVTARISEGSKRVCYLVCENDPQGVVRVRALQTAGEFDKRNRRRLRTNKKPRYKNVRPFRNRYVTVH